MTDPIFKIVLQGVDQNASSSVDKVVDKLNKAKEATKRWNDERAKLAKQDRVDKFRQLSDEEKLVRLRERQVQIERRLATATQQGNALRASALKLAAARNRASMGGLSASSGGGVGDLISATGSAAGLGGFVGGPVGAAVAAAIATVGYAFQKSVTSAVEFADNISDLADQTGLTRVQILRLQRAAGAAGVSSGVPLAALSALSAARGSALAGDANATASFGKYGITRAMLAGDTDNLSLAMQIQRSLGSGGMNPTDRGPLGTLLGRRPERTLSVLKTLQGVSVSNPMGAESDLAKLDSVKAKFEDLVNKWKMIMVNVSAALFNASDAIAPYLSKGFQTSRGALALFNWATTDSSPLPLSPEAQARKDARMKRTASNSVIGMEVSPTYRSPVPQADALARMGFYIGGGPNSTNNVMSQQLIELRLIKEATRSSSQAIRSL